MKNALILGITGQDGSYLAELLLEKGYSVFGIKRRTSLINTGRIDHILPDIHLQYGDVTDPLSIIQAIQWAQPDEIYNLAAQSHVRVSFDAAVYTNQVDLLGPLHILEAMRLLDCRARFYQASSSEIFGRTAPPQSEGDEFQPCSPYAAAKLAAFWTTRNYREAYGMHASNGILFNHESPRRGETFVTRKIARAAARMEKVTLGNLTASRDWGHARDYVKAMWLMLQEEAPDDYVIATGESHTVREFAEEAYRHAGMELEWIRSGSGYMEQGVDKDTGAYLVETDPRYFRPIEVPDLRGDCKKAQAVLKWRPETTFTDLVREMVDAES